MNTNTRIDDSPTAGRPLAGRIGIVTGGSSGIGRAAVVAFVDAGARVMIGDVDENGAHETITLAGGDDAVAFVRTDVSAIGDAQGLVDQTVERFGRLDFAFDNAGIELMGATLLHELSDADWRRVVDVNLTGAWNCVRAQVPAMRRAGGGSIVITSSGLGLGAMPGHSAYVAAKSGVIGLTKSGAVEYGAENIRVNCVCPGAINTPMFLALQEAEPGIAQAARERNPMKRFGEPEEIAAAAVWLASDASSYVNGHALLIDGGHGIAR
jgi:NAD(P)-dependent dehydrogenase (short-subunit alcohol dehydrogenase family)